MSHGIDPQCHLAHFPSAGAPAPRAPAAPTRPANGRNRDKSGLQRALRASAMPPACSPSNSRSRVVVASLPRPVERAVGGSRREAGLGVSGGFASRGAIWSVSKKVSEINILGNRLPRTPHPAMGIMVATPGHAHFHSFRNRLRRFQLQAGREGNLREILA